MGSQEISGQRPIQSQSTPLAIMIPGTPFIGSLSGHDATLQAFSALVYLFLGPIRAFGQEMANVLMEAYTLSANVSRSLGEHLSSSAIKAVKAYDAVMYSDGDNLYSSDFLNKLQTRTQEEGKTTATQLLKGQGVEGQHQEVDTAQAKKDEQRMAMTWNGKPCSMEELQTHFTDQQITNIRALTSQTIAADIMIALNDSTNSLTYNSPARITFDIREVKRGGEQFIKISANMIAAKTSLDDDMNKLYQDNLELTRDYYLSKKDADTDWVTEESKPISSLEVMDHYSPITIRGYILAKYEGVTGKEKAEIVDKNTIKVTIAEVVRSYSSPED
jgi:hypothetical protein